MIRVTFLGTAAARPTVGRNVTSISVQREGESMLFDCGEGTQRQMMRFGTGFSLERIFFTHVHADHFLGVVGLLRTMALQGRTAPMHLFGPKGSGKVLRQAVNLGVERISFPVFIEELDPGEAVSREEYEVAAYPADHGPAALGYVLREHPRPGRFDVEKARALGVPEGPLFGRLHAGESVEVDGRTVRPDEVVGPPRPGRTVVYSGDTRPSEATVDVARKAELLIHDATFTEEEAERAHETYHATARGAAKVARDAEVKRLVLTHISARYAENPRIMEREARGIFPGAVVASDGDIVEIPYGDSEGDG
ncbi:MAG: ribonuclease Z [Longimicrobiales bacterium]|nr:ribonuclease Z [Longimicrobiales bacterium]